MVGNSKREVYRSQCKWEKSLGSVIMIADDNMQDVSQGMIQLMFI